VTRALVLSGSLLVLSGCLTFHAGAMPGEPKNALFAEVEGARVRYTDRGEGPAVVMIHGYASSLETWDAVAPVLAKSRRVIAVDLKGFGWTDRPEGDYSPAAQAKLILALLDKLRVDRFAIVAHSWGSSVALQIALSVPERVTRLALYDAWGYEEQLPTTFWWARAPVIGELLWGLYYDQLQESKLALGFYDKSYVTQDLVDAVERAFERPGTLAAALATVRGMRYAEVQKSYSTVKQPVLLMYGREDTTTPVSVGERFAQQLPSATLEVYPRCGHLPMIESYAATTARLVRFLEEER
jgi:pimeloyl-ACP methyl ester carboxylesterase